MTESFATFVFTYGVIAWVGLAYVEFLHKPAKALEAAAKKK